MAFDNMEWFCAQKRVVQQHYINFGGEARHEDGPYADSHVDYTDWKVSEYSVAVLYPLATTSLVLPSTYMLIQKARRQNVL